MRYSEKIKRIEIHQFIHSVVCLLILHPFSCNAFKRNFSSVRSLKLRSIFTLWYYNLEIYVYLFISLTFHLFPIDGLKYVLIIGKFVIKITHMELFPLPILVLLGPKYSPNYHVFKNPLASVPPCGMFLNKFVQ